MVEVGDVGEAGAAIADKVAGHARAGLVRASPDPTRVGLLRHRFAGGAVPGTRVAVAAAVEAAAPRPVVVGRALVVAHPVLVAPRPHVAVAHRPVRVEALDVPRAATAPVAGDRVLLAGRVVEDGEAGVLVHLGPVAPPAGARPALPTRGEAVAAKDRLDLGVAAAPPVGARAVAALIAEGVGGVPGPLRRHPAPRHAPLPVGVQVRRPLGGEPPAKASVGAAPGRTAAGVGAAGAAGRPAVEAGPDEGPAAVVLVYAVAGQVRSLVAVLGLNQAITGIVVAHDGLALGFWPDA